MKTERFVTLTLEELMDGCTMSEDGEVTKELRAWGGKLLVHPQFQREFIYTPRQQKAVIDSVIHGDSMGMLYFWKENDNKYELIDGQQRVSSICRFMKGLYSVGSGEKALYYDSMSDDQRKTMDDYTFSVCICEGNEADKLRRFRKCNTVGTPLKHQELLNAMYYGPFVNDLKINLGSRKTRKNASKLADADSLMGGDAIRQDYVAKVLFWIASREHLTVPEYMSLHRNDASARDVLKYFDDVCTWADDLFGHWIKGDKKDVKLVHKVHWGLLYNMVDGTRIGYDAVDGTKLTYDAEDFVKRGVEYLADGTVTRKVGVFEYLLTENEKALSVRAFSSDQKTEVLSRDGFKCAICKRVFKEPQLHCDHIKPFKYGGRTVVSNCQLLCESCNEDKSSSLKQSEKAETPSMEDKDPTTDEEDY